MAVHILLSIALTWLALIALNHLILFSMFPIWQMRGLSAKQAQRTSVYSALVFTGSILLYPVFVLLTLPRQIRRVVIAYRIARMLESKHAHVSTCEIDLTILPEDEQRVFWRRLHSDEDKGVILHEAQSRIREVQEAAR